MFFGAAFNITSVNKFNRSTFSDPSEVKYSPVSNRYYVVDSTRSDIVEFDNNFNYISLTSFGSVISVDPYDENLFVATKDAVLKYDFNFILKKRFTSPVSSDFAFLKYSNTTNYLYLCDQMQSTLTVFDAVLNQSLSESFPITGKCASVMPLDNGIILYGDFTGQLYVYSNKTFVTVYQVCSTNYVPAMWLDGTSYLLISCYNDKVIKLYTISGTVVTYTNLVINTAGFAQGFILDPFDRLVVGLQKPNRVDIYTLI